MADMKRLLAVVLLLSAAVALSAQESTQWSANGGQLTMLPKRSHGFSGSLGFSLTRGESAFPGIGGSRYEGSVSAPLIEDRLWFFGSMERGTQRIGAMPQEAAAQAFDARTHATLGDRQNLAVVFSDMRQPAASLFTVPSSFLSMRYDAVISGNMLFSASASRSAVHGTAPLLP